MAAIPPVRIVGCGRWSMGDDQAGLAIAERLRQCGIPDTIIIGSEAPGTELPAGLSEAVRLLVIIDAAVADDRHAPGTFDCLRYGEQPQLVAARSRGDTHSLSVDAGLRLATALDLLPKNTWIYAIFGTNFDRCLDLSPEIGVGIEPLTQRIERDVREWLAEHVSDQLIADP